MDGEWENAKSSEGGDSWISLPVRGNLSRVSTAQESYHTGICQSQNLILESRLEWQHFLHPFSVPHCGTFWPLTEEKSSHPFFFFMLVVKTLVKVFVKAAISFATANWKQKGGWFDDCVGNIFFNGFVKLCQHLNENSRTSSGVALRQDNQVW